MSEETNPGQEPDVTDTEGVTPETQPTADVQSTEEEAFDKERALATIRKLRQHEREAEQLRKRVASYEAAEREAEMARLSETERLQAQLKQREAELDFERQQHRDRQNQYELQLQASRLGVVDPEAAAKLLDWSHLEYDDDGRPTNLGDALNDLLERKPYLKAQTAPTQQTRTPTATTNPATRSTPAGTRIYTAAELSDRAFWNANKDDIMRALRENRVTD